MGNHRKWEANRNFGTLQDPPMSERIQKLEELGFWWAMPKRVPWGERFQELQQFASAEGHCQGAAAPRLTSSSFVLSDR
jgi:hypothetical protein